MKKAIITALLTVSLTMPAFAFNDVDGSKWKEEIGGLSDLEIVSGYGDDTFRPDGTLTRAEAAVFVTNALGSYGAVMLDMVQDSDSMFADVGNDHFAVKQINLLSMLDIIAGYEDGDFRPENSVTYGELVKMCMGITGYGDLVPKTENWVSGYVETGGKYGFFEGLEMTDDLANTPASREDTAKIIFNTIHVPLRQETGIGADGVVRQIMDGTNGTELMTCFTEYFES